MFTRLNTSVSRTSPRVPNRCSTTLVSFSPLLRMCDDLHSEKHLLNTATVVPTTEETSSTPPPVDDEECPPPPKKQRRIGSRKISLLPIIAILTTAVQMDLIRSSMVSKVLRLMTKKVLGATRPIPQIWDQVLNAFSCFSKGLHRPLDDLDSAAYSNITDTVSDDLLFTTSGNPDDLRTLEDLFRTSLAEYLNSVDQTDSGFASSMTTTRPHMSISSTIAPTVISHADADPFPRGGLHPHKKVLTNKASYIKNSLFIYYTSHNSSISSSSNQSCTPKVLNCSRSSMTA
nr:uncharacterized protein LOC106685440 [Halyomorpha halys]